MRFQSRLQIDIIGLYLEALYFESLRYDKKELR